MLAARLVVVPLIPVYPGVIRRVPLLLRIAACAMVSYLLSSIIVQPYVDRGQATFTPLVVAIFGSFVAAALLLPGRGWDRDGRAGGPAAHVTGQRPSAAGPAPPPAAGPDQTGSVAFTALAWTRRLAGLSAGVGVLLVGLASPAAADNCSGLSDCSFGVKIALVVAAIALVAIAIVLLPEILGLGALEAEAAAAEAAAAEAAEAAAAEGLSEAELEQAFDYANTESKLAHVFDKPAAWPGRAGPVRGR